MVIDIAHFLSAPWMIQPQWVHQFIGSIVGLYNAGSMKEEFGAFEKDYKKQYTVFKVYNSHGKVSEYEDLGAIEDEKSVLIVPAHGPITHYGQQRTIETINTALYNERIASVVFDVDSPGGTAMNNDLVDQAVHRFADEKPCYTYVGRMMCSAAMYSYSGTHGIYAGSPTHQIGSIGTMMSMSDMEPMFEKWGVKFHEIFATLSTEKGRLYNEVKKGEYQEVRETVLDVFNEQFHTAIKSNLPGVSKKVFSGGVYFAKKAEKLNLIHGIKSLDEVVQLAQLKSISNSKMGLFSKEKTPKSKEAFEAAQNGGEPTRGQLTAANKELASQKSGLRLMSASDLGQAVEAVKTLSQTQTERDDAIKAKEQAEEDLNKFKSDNPGTSHTATSGKEGGEGEQSYGWTSYLNGGK